MDPTKKIISHLKVIIRDDVEPNIIEYLRGMQNEEDLEEFMENIIDRNNSAHMAAYEGIRKMLFGNKNKKKEPSPSTVNLPSSSTNKKNIAAIPSRAKGKKKFSDINTFKEKKKQREGRQICDCEGQEHEFMNNCLNCGRIHCIEEGPGPCFFCGEFITIMGQETFQNRKDNKSLKHKENKVFDDDNDYFKTSAEKKSGKKEKMVIALDFATRKVIESTAEDLKIREKLHSDIKKHLENVDKLYKKLQKQSDVDLVAETSNDLVDLLIQMRHKKPQGVENLGEEDSTPQVIDYGTKVYDEEVIANTDHGLCLSLHQPYASLLIAGVKKHEGRTWKTNHRGRLWIAAAAKEPDEDEVEALETFYRQYYNDQTLKFPRSYPTSCLLGCVFVEDCLDQNTYRSLYPNGESTSPYVLICSNPIILPIFYPIVGQHKIYPLDKELHNCAKLSIRHAQYVLD